MSSSSELLIHSWAVVTPIGFFECAPTLAILGMTLVPVFHIICILELEEARALDGDTLPIIILLFTQDGVTESEIFGNSMVFGLN